MNSRRGDVPETDEDLYRIIGRKATRKHAGKWRSPATRSAGKILASKNEKAKEA